MKTLFSLNSFSLSVDLHDVWIGFYWRFESLFKNGWRFDIYICLLPVLPIHIWFGSMGSLPPDTVD